MFCRIPGQDNSLDCCEAGDGLVIEKEFPQRDKIHNMTLQDIRQGYRDGFLIPGQQQHLFMGAILISKTSTCPLSVVLFVVTPKQVLVLIALASVSCTLASTPHVDTDWKC